MLIFQRQTWACNVHWLAVIHLHRVQQAMLYAQGALQQVASVHQTSTDQQPTLAVKVFHFT